MGIKITLGEAHAQHVWRVTFCCFTPTPGGGWCNHAGEMDIDAAIARWGEGRRLDDIPARCTRCGRRGNVDVRARERRRVGGAGVGPFVE